MTDTQRDQTAAGELRCPRCGTSECCQDAEQDFDWDPDPVLPDPGRVVRKLKCYTDEQMADIRRAVADEIATALEAMRDVRLPDIDWDCTPAIEQTLAHAAAIAREIGERHV